MLFVPAVSRNKKRRQVEKEQLEREELRRRLLGEIMSISRMAIACNNNYRNRPDGEVNICLGKLVSEYIQTSNSKYTVIVGLECETAWTSFLDRKGYQLFKIDIIVNDCQSRIDFFECQHNAGKWWSIDRLDVLKEDIFKRISRYNYYD